MSDDNDVPRRQDPPWTGATPVDSTPGNSTPGNATPGDTTRGDTVAGPEAIGPAGSDGGESPGYGGGQPPPPDEPSGGPAGRGEEGSAPARPSNAGRIALVVAVVLVLMAGSAVVGGIVGAVGFGLVRDEGDGPTTVVDAPQLDYSSLATIASQVSPSVVSIGVGQSGQGSGVVMNDQGHIMTNAHVVEAAQGGQVRVSFSSGEVAPATIVGANPATDIAVIQVDGVDALTPASFGASSDLLVGDTVLALGSPLGFEGSVTQGIISALDRSLPRQEGPSLSGLLQTDAAINPGNSGGALVNMDGEVIGINTAIATTGQMDRSFLGVGFAVPSDRARDVAEALIAGEDVRQAFLGVSVGTSPDGGAVIGRVEPGSPADEAGLRQGDVVVRFDDREVNDTNDLVSAVQSHQVGDSVEVELVRQGETMTVTVTLGAYQD